MERVQTKLKNVNKLKIQNKETKLQTKTHLPRLAAYALCPDLMTTPGFPTTPNFTNHQSLDFQQYIC
jgi:hypothetical protein